MRQKKSQTGYRNVKKKIKKKSKCETRYAILQMCIVKASSHGPSPRVRILPQWITPCRSASVYPVKPVPTIQLQSVSKTPIRSLFSVFEAGMMARRDAKATLIRKQQHHLSPTAGAAAAKD